MHHADSWTRLLRHYGHWKAFGYGPMLCFDRNGMLVAEAGFADFRRGMGDRFDGAPEAMWKVDIDHHGKGFATEAMAAITSWFDASQQARRTVCMIDPANTPSIRVAERLGFREYARAAFRGPELVLFERKRPPAG